MSSSKGALFKEALAATLTFSGPQLPILVAHSIRPPQPDRTDLAIVPLRNIEAVRTPAFGTNGSQTGAIVEPVTMLVILSESSIEKKVFRSLLADSNVISVRHQALTIAYLGGDGLLKHHTVDLVATLRDGTRIGYVVKKESAAIKHDMRGLVEKMATFVPTSKLDRLQLVTSRQLPEWGNQNARKLLNARRDRRTHIDDQLIEIAAELVKPIRIGDLSRRLGGGSIAFRPILRAIRLGTLTYLGFGVIDQNGLVKFSGNVMADTDLPGPRPEISAILPPVILRRKPALKPKRRLDVNRL